MPTATSSAGVGSAKSCDAADARDSPCTGTDDSSKVLVACAASSSSLVMGTSSALSLLSSPSLPLLSLLLCSPKCCIKSKYDLAPTGSNNLSSTDCLGASSFASSMCALNRGSSACSSSCSAFGGGWVSTNCEARCEGWMIDGRCPPFLPRSGFDPRNASGSS